MDKLKQYKYVILVVLLLGFAFYWYSYRPYRVTKACITYAMDRANEVKEIRLMPDIFSGNARNNTA